MADDERALAQPLSLEELDRLDTVWHAYLRADYQQEQPRVLLRLSAMARKSLTLESELAQLRRENERLASELYNAMAFRRG